MDATRPVLPLYEVLLWQFEIFSNGFEIYSAFENAPCGPRVYELVAASGSKNQNCF